VRDFRFLDHCRQTPPSSNLVVADIPERKPGDVCFLARSLAAICVAILFCSLDIAGKNWVRSANLQSWIESCICCTSWIE